MTTTDCLILKIEEVDIAHDNDIESEIFIIYDKNNNNYIIRGKRVDIGDIHFNTFSFICESVNHLTSFLSFIIDNHNKVIYTLYNHDDLPILSNEIYFETLAKSLTDSHEVVEYEMEDFSNEILRNRVEILKHVYNYY